MRVIGERRFSRLFRYAVWKYCGSLPWLQVSGCARPDGGDGLKGEDRDVAIAPLSHSNSEQPNVGSDVENGVPGFHSNPVGHVSLDMGVQHLGLGRLNAEDDRTVRHCGFGHGLTHGYLASEHTTIRGNRNKNCDEVEF